MIKSEVSLKISAMRFKANILESFIFWSHSNFSISSLISNVPNLSSPIRNNSHRECHETWNFEKEKKKRKRSQWNNALRIPRVIRKRRFPIAVTYDCNHTHYPLRYRDETTQNPGKAARADNEMVYRDASFVYSQLVTSLRGPSSTKFYGVRSNLCPPEITGPKCTG